MRKLLSGFLLLGVVASSNADACSFVQGATADAKVFHNGAQIYQNGVVGCYNQQTGGNASCTTALQHVGENAATQAIINSLKGRGGCGSVGVQVAVRLGTRDRVDCGNKNYDTGGTWIAAVAASCPQGGTLSGSTCNTTVAVTKTCPAGWLANQTNVDGGVTADGVCKKAVAGCSLPAPLPANGTQIGSSGSYGFTWGNSVNVFGNAGNGGAAIPSCPRGFAQVGNNCVKSYPATPGVAAYCKR